MTNDSNRVQFRASKRTLRQLAELAHEWGYGAGESGELHRRIVEVAHAATFGKQAQTEPTLDEQLAEAVGCSVEEVRRLLGGALQAGEGER